MKTRLILLSLYFFILMNYQLIKAQETNIKQLEYDNEIESVLSDSQTEAEFNFTGKAGDVIVIDVTAKEVLSGLQPELQLLNERGTTLASTSDIQDGLENFDVFRSVLPFEIPADGDYTILVTDGPFHSAQPDAKFTLRLLEPLILETDTAISDSALKSVNNYYVVISKQAFKIEYHKTAGDSAPAINLDRIENGKRERLSTVYGASLNEASMSVVPNRNTLHLVTITRSPYDLDVFGTATVEYTLKLTIA